MAIKHARAALVGVLALSVAGCATDGSDRTERGATRTVEVVMRDNTFRPDRIDVRRGEEVTFRFVNNGRLVHEAFLGDSQAQEQHAAEMAEGDDHGGASPDGHAGHLTGQETEQEMVTVRPGEEAALYRRFDEAGTVIIGCHQPGHWEAGMRATVEVS